MKIAVRKEGNVHTVFMDGNSPAWFTSFDAVPPGFPMTFNSKSELVAKFGQHEYVMIEEARPPQPVNTRPRNAAEIAAIMNEQPKHDDALNRALQIIRDLIMQQLSSPANIQQSIAERIKLYEKFVCSVWPGSEQQLAKVRHTCEQSASLLS